MRKKMVSVFFIIVLLAVAFTAQDEGEKLSLVPEAVPPEQVAAAPCVIPAPPAPPPPVALPEGFFEDDIFFASYAAALSLLERMPLEEKVGQIFLARYPTAKAEELIHQYHPGGFILFSRDFTGKTKDAVVDEIASFQEAARTPMAVAVDEEGGTVVRVSRNSALRDRPFPSPQALFKSGEMEAIRADAVEKSLLLLSLGINLNLAPVCDISENPNDYIYPRTFGQPAFETAYYTQTVVFAMVDSGISCALKHFPGYAANVDTHVDTAFDERPIESFRQSDFLPFQSGINAGAQFVLVSHNIVSCVDSSLPASLSPGWHRLLRAELRFSGLIITDDLAMDAVSKYITTDSAAVDALYAGNDMIIVTDLEKEYAAVLSAVEEDEQLLLTLDQAVLRVLAWKVHQGIIPPEQGYAPLPHEQPQP